MGPKLFSLFFSAALMICSIADIHGKLSPNLQKKKTDIDNIDKNISSNQRRLNEYDTYITIYFKEDV